MRATVIGAGVVGLSVASALAAHGARVTVLEADRILGGTSSRGLAWVNASNKYPREYFLLNAAGVRAHASLSESAATPWFYRTGTVTARSYRTGLGDKSSTYRGWGYPVKEGRINDFLETDSNPPYGLEPADFYPDEGWIDIEAFSANALANLTGTGGAVIEGAEVTSLVPGSSGYRVGISDRPNLEADIVVNAAGTGAPAVAALVGRQVPMRNRWGIVAQVETPERRLGRVIMHDLIDIRPGPGRVHFLHSDAVDATLPENPAGADAESQLMQLLHRAQRLHPAFEGAVLRGHTVGLRPIPADGFPVIGSVATLPGYYEAVSHSGLTLAPVIGEILAAQILGKFCNGFDLSLFNPDRFAG